MLEISSEKVYGLKKKWLCHEVNIQKQNIKEINFPIYLFADRLGKEGYFFCRNYYYKLFFIELDAKENLLSEFKKIMSDLEKDSKSDFNLIIKEYLRFDEKFFIQWDNIFDKNFTHKGTITKELLSSYQYKYEIEYFLKFLSTLRKYISDKELDFCLDKYKDNQGKYKKGVLADYVKKGFKDYPIFKDLLNYAYISKLRNMIGHNEYQFSENGIANIDNTYNINNKDFFDTYNSLQLLHGIIQNYFSMLTFNKEVLKEKGILAIGWAKENEEIVLFIYQLNLFFKLSKEKDFIYEVNITIYSNEMIETKINEVIEKGKLSKEWILKLEKQSEVKTYFIPIELMILNNNDKSLFIKNEEFYQCGKEQEKILKLTYKKQ